ncbi:acyltransferase family protein [Amaricoccus solimangrovi]|uniref:Acyltransferase n=1 Tax=Amaricoccus solimangrovi TaxID=2589815 RepID=A0A501WXR4_9RHOB|nr:acyltransferase family protein [Amaricoccus solimangrovi]TPE53035.1 acyltransferase [Amaricoccus solimangrovi]
MSDALSAGTAIPETGHERARARPGVAFRYRPEIDGLRALAILPVVLFHAGYSAFSGGFVGVDVFFVISGYLITSLVMRDIAQDRFSILGFYERRARRILPAMIFVVLACVPLAAVFLLPSALHDFGRSITATMLFYANHFFLDHVDYFAPRADLMPLLHMWSLAVEEQYYLFVPPLMWLVWRLGARQRIMLALFGAASLLSVIGASLIVQRWPGVAFFIFPTRAFELGIGSILALVLRERELPRSAANGPLALLGVALILGAVLLIPADAPMPSWLSLIPCLGAALVIAFATEGTPARAFLASRPLVGIGLVSFSLYLWHQPLFAFARSVIAEPSPWLMGALGLLSALLAVLSWRFVEQPARRARMSRTRLLGLAALALVATAALGQLVAREAARLHPLAPEDAQLDVSFEDRGEYVRHRYNALPNDFSGAAPGQPRLFIIGDSFSQDFWNMSVENGAFRGWAVATRYIPTVCQTYFGRENVDRFVEPTSRRRCRYYRRADMFEEAARAADVVVFVTRWTPWAAERLEGSVANLGLPPATKVIVVGAKGFGDVLLPGYVGRDAAGRAAVRVEPTAFQTAGTPALARAFGPERFVDLEAMLCPDGSCALFTPEGALISHDGDHLTEAGAKAVGAVLYRSPLLAPYLQPADPAASR